MTEEFNLDSSLGKLGFEIPDCKSLRLAEAQSYQLKNVYVNVCMFGTYLYLTVRFLRLKRPQIVQLH